ncbi:SURF1 family protein [Sandaracinobacteroides sayramensis]|uniref:SURF1 family protein n=1 Tax=Sandaracinobacteroides sayramensis TaxID=2913411 RepID=UPI00300D1685
MTDAVGARPFAGRAMLAAICLLLAGGFVWLGIWQLERRQWKHELIAAVDARAHNAPVPAPGPAEWPNVSARSHAYLRVHTAGRFLPVAPAFVTAVTELGSGYWVMSPMETAEGIILVNRGFVPTRSVTPPAPDVYALAGLLRLTEPDGGFLRRNDPAADRWYSRDVAAIATSRGLERVAPYFIDADNAIAPVTSMNDMPGNLPGEPLGGLTVIRFSDNHLVYALTWFALAAMSLFAVLLLVRGRQARDGG